MNEITALQNVLRNLPRKIAIVDLVCFQYYPTFESDEVRVERMTNDDNLESNSTELLVY